jgi:hypothetical protein
MEIMTMTIAMPRSEAWDWLAGVVMAIYRGGMIGWLSGGFMG